MIMSRPDADWCVRNSILHRDLEFPTIAKYMKDVSKRFFDIAESHPSARQPHMRPSPTILSVGHGMYLSIYLTHLQRRNAQTVKEKSFLSFISPDIFYFAILEGKEKKVRIERISNDSARQK
ncbi:hypothetical protein EVAR_41050_1 [Eumeta japonica]|uniref:Uncharacterized protein n=1 Tax=Eumeta variegata TaxID=151549 RepID=A0A4C1XVS4_EUMVA|nr:hypothetical protein EVAR_41050_1 [Eumeta japonica]